MTRPGITPLARLDLAGDVQACATAGGITFAADATLVAWPDGTRTDLPSGGPVTAIAVAGDALLLGRGEGQVLSWHGGAVAWRRRTEWPGVLSLAWHPEGWVAAGHREPFVGILDAATGRPLTTLDPEVFDDEGRTAVAVSPDGGLLASTAYHHVLLWPADQVTSGRAKPRRLSLDGHRHVTDVVWLDGGARLAGLVQAEYGSELHLWAIDGRTHLAQERLPARAHRLVSPGGRGVWYDTPADLVAWPAAGGDGPPLDLAGSGEVSSLAASPEGTLVAAGTRDGFGLIWRPTEGGTR
jgi:WD40 repeat protein